MLQLVWLVQNIANAKFTEVYDSDIFASSKLVQVSCKAFTDIHNSSQVSNCLLHAMINFIIYS